MGGNTPSARRASYRIAYLGVELPMPPKTNAAPKATNGKDESANRSRRISREE